MSNAVNLAPDLLFTNVADTVTEALNNSTFTSLFGGIAVNTPMKVTADYWSALTTNDPITNLSIFYRGLDSTAFPTLDNQYISFWLKKFNSSVDLIKNNVYPINPADNNSFFGSFSDSIGLQANSKIRLTDAVLPISDTQFKLGAPQTLPVSVNSKVSALTQNILNTAAKVTTGLFRTNIKQIQQPNVYTNAFPQSQTAHGQNLVTDLNHYTVIQPAVSQFSQTVYSTFPRVSSYVGFLCNIGDLMAYNPRDTVNSQNTSSNNNQNLNQQVSTSLTFNLSVEGTAIPVGITLQPIQTTLVQDVVTPLQPLAPASIPINVTTEYIDQTFASTDESFLCNQTTTLPVTYTSTIESIIIQQQNINNFQQSVTNVEYITAQAPNVPDPVPIITTLTTNTPTPAAPPTCTGFKLPSFPLPNLSFLKALIIPDLAFKLLNLIPKFPRINLLQLLENAAFNGIRICSSIIRML
jgi:hypothetical protein